MIAKFEKVKMAKVNDYIAQEVIARGKKRQLGLQFQLWEPKNEPGLFANLDKGKLVEEDGKIYHEMPVYEVSGYLTPRPARVAFVNADGSYYNDGQVYNTNVSRIHIVSVKATGETIRREIKPEWLEAVKLYIDTDETATTTTTKKTRKSKKQQVEFE